MRLVVERGVPQEERQKVAIGSLTDWDAARVFLEVVRCGSFRSAAERLDLSINGVRRRIDDFERQIGATLFTRSNRGVELTNAGRVLLDDARRFLSASLEASRKVAEESVQFMASRMGKDGTSQVTAFNPLSWPRREWVEATVRLPRGAATGEHA